MRKAKGSGTTVRISGKWHARFRRADLPDLYGPARETRDEAEQDRLTMARAPKPKRSNNPIFQEFGRESLEGAYGQSLSDTSFTQAEGIFSVHLWGTKLGRKRVRQITRDDLQQWVDEQTAVRRSKVDGVMVETYVKPAAATVHRRYAVVSVLLTLAEHAGYIGVSPAKRIILPKLEERENTHISEDLARRLLSAESRIEKIIVFAIHTGLSRSEITRVRWEDIEDGILNVRGTKNEFRRRPVPLTSEALTLLASLARTSEYVFAGDNGQQLRPHRVSVDYRAAKERLGIPKAVRLQDMRGLFLSILFRAGVDLRTGMELVGHNNPRTTLKAYLRTMTSTKRDAALRLSQRIGLVDGVSEDSTEEVG